MRSSQIINLVVLFLCWINISAQDSHTQNIAGSLGESNYINIVLSRPSDKAITVSLLPIKNLTFYIEYRKSTETYTAKTEIRSAVKGIPVEIELGSLTPNTQYYYRILYSENSSAGFITGDEHSFSTQKAKGSTFTFVIEADPHLYDKKGSSLLMKVAMQNELNDKPDFLIDLGDTFGDDHRPFEITDAEIKQLHLNFRGFAGAVCHSMPFLFCIGNHEGESGYYLLQTPPSNIAVNSTLARKYYFPNPVPNNFYSGNTQSEGYGIGLPENYFAWEWGDALFVVLDAYRYYTANAKPRNWDWTLGETQYKWFKQALESSKAKFKFVFIHHILGETRGGLAVSKDYEWGGYNNKDVWEFDKMRPGWGLPIHQLMKNNGVNIFFQGHDHLYAKEDVDGIVYQEVPMPCDSTYLIGTTDNGDAYGGVKIDASGHLRVTVSPANTTVDYVRAWLPVDETAQHKNGEVAYSYTVFPKTTSVETVNSIPSKYSLEQNYPNPFNPTTKIRYQLKEAGVVSLKVFDLLGREVKTLVNQLQPAGLYESTFDAAGLKSGTYFYQLTTGNEVLTKKALLLK